MTNLLIKIFIGNNDVKNQDVRKKYGYLGAFTGIILNIFLFSVKLVAGLLSGAISIMADAFNNLSDAGSSIITFVGFKVAGTPADEEHPFGHGRMEYVSGLIISFIIMLMAFELGKGSIEKIINPEVVEFSYISLIILILSVLIKLWMFVFNRKLGKLIDSMPMKATAMDSLTDSIATTAVIIAVIIYIITGANIDGYVGVLVALFIAYTGINTFRESLSPLLGVKPDRTLVKEIEEQVMNYPLIVGIHDLIVHDYGVGNMIISFHAEVPCETDFSKAHELIDLIEDDLKIQYNCIVSIHMDPVAKDDEETNEAKQKVLAIIGLIDERLSIHDFRITKGTIHMNLIFDIVVPFCFKMTDSELVELIRDEIMKTDEKYFAVINVDKNMT